MQIRFVFKVLTYKPTFRLLKLKLLPDIHAIFAMCMPKKINCCVILFVYLSTEYD